MRVGAWPGTMVALGITMSSVGCAPATATSPRVAATGSLVFTGAITATVAENTQTRADCQMTTSTPLPPATDPVVVTLTGRVSFGSGSGAVSLTFAGGPGTWNLPLPGEIKPVSPGVIGTPALVRITSAGGAVWTAGQDSPASSRTVTLSKSGTGAVHGAIDAVLAPVGESSATLHATGAWSC